MSHKHVCRDLECPGCDELSATRMVGADRLAPADFGLAEAEPHHAHDAESRRRDAIGLTEAVRVAHTDKHAPMTALVRPGETGHAKKMDLGKPPIAAGFLRYFARAVIAVAYISEYGARKYAEPGKPTYSPAWQEVPNGEQRYGDAEERHRVKTVLEGDYDAESEMAHLAHKAWNALAELEIALREKRIQCRIGVVVLNGVPQPGTSKVVEL